MGLSEVSQLSELSEKRLWKTLDNISNRLTGIEDKLSEVVRLEERVNNHEEALSRFGKRIDNHGSRIREAELWQAHHGDKSSVERLITNVQDEMVGLKNVVNNLETKTDISKGHTDIWGVVLKWLFGILAAVIIIKLGSGLK